ncbi:MAG: V-type ATP synthase subunit E [Chloroflexi bacterium]|nr:V-type ATP synthase subunit E [Chloroflexota bacterium]
MDKIKEAIISKVRMEAEDITREAEEKAQEEIERARRQREARFAEERGRILTEMEAEAARTLAQASIKARQKLSSTKADIIAEIVDRARRELSRVSSDESHILNLVREATEGLAAARGRIYVSPKDVGTVRKLLEAHKDLSDRIVEVRESSCLGGVIAEDVEGKLRIDNTYETRLEMLLPRLLPEISKKLFESP